MAWFALHPPDGVRVVPFFITSRWGGYSDWTEFTAIAAGQLAEILAEPDPIRPRIDEFWSLLGRAARACADQGQRLVLVVDGLDEDLGVTGGRGAHSIAALLPDRPEAGMRVIVSGRLTPSIPSDMGDSHPLRDPAIVRELTPSPVALVIREDMKRELAGLRAGSRAEREVLGLIAAARGGLNAVDLAELIAAGAPDAQGPSAAEVSDLLATVAGRSFMPIPSRWQPETGQEAYVLAHQELQDETEKYLDADGLHRYRGRLRAWADVYRGQGWPPRTSEYLLQGYPKMLHSASDLARLVELAADSRRHSRMLQITGGDGLALAEIAATQEALRAASPPDVSAVARLAVHYQSLARRGGELPWGLAAVWARTGAGSGREGNVARAREIARSFTDPARRCVELLQAGDALAGRDSDSKARAFTDDALIAAREVIRPGLQAQALAKVARMYAQLGDIGQAREIIADAEAQAADLSNRDSRESALVMITAAVAASGQADAAIRVARSVTTDLLRAEALQLAARTAADAGDVGAADAFLEAIDVPGQRAWALGAMITALAEGARRAEAGSLATRAEAAAKDIPEVEWRAKMLGAVAYALAQAGLTQRAWHFVRLAKAAVRNVPPSENARPRIPVSVACALVLLGEISEALAIARSEDGASRRKAVAVALARAGQPDEAESLANEIDEPTASQLARELARGGLGDIARGMGRSEVLPRLDALASLARVAADTGDARRAIRLCELIEAATTFGAVRFQEETTPGDLAEALAAAGHAEEALALAGAIGDYAERMRALIVVTEAARYDKHAEVLTAIRSWGEEQLVAAGLAMVAKTAALAGDAPLAAGLADEAVNLARRIGGSSGSVTQFPILKVAACVMAAIGEPERACSIASLLAETESFRDVALSEAAAAAADAGQLDSAEHVALALSHPSDRAGALAAAAMTAVRVGQPDRARALAHASADEPLGTARPTMATSAQSGPDFAFASISEVLDGPGSRTDARAAADSILQARTPTMSSGLMTGTGAAPAAMQYPSSGAVTFLPGPGWRAQSFTLAAMPQDLRTEVSALLTEVFAAIGDHAQARTTADAILAAARTIHSPRYKSDALCHAARAMVACGETEKALPIIDEAMTAATDIGTWRKREAAERAALRARGLVARAAARDGNLETAKAITDAITADDIRAAVITDLARDLAAAGDEAGAVKLAWSTDDPLGQAGALAVVAKTVTGSRGQALIGQALQVGSWEPCLAALVEVAPDAVAAIAAEVRRFPPAAGPDRTRRGPLVIEVPDPTARRSDSDLVAAARAGIEQAFARLRELPGLGEEAHLPALAAELVQRAADLAREGRLPEAVGAAREAALLCDQNLYLDEAYLTARAVSGMILGHALISADQLAEAITALTDTLITCQPGPPDTGLADTLVSLLENAILGASAAAHERDETDTADDEGAIARIASIAILRARATPLGDTDAGRVADALEDLPLGIFLAAGYLAETGMPADEYLDLLAATAADIPIPEAGQQQAYPRPLAAAALLAVEGLSLHEPAAADLVRLCAYLAPAPIPLGLLAGAAVLPEELGVEVTDLAGWVRMADQLESCGLASGGRQGLLMHRTTQNILRDQMPPVQAAVAQARAEAVLLACEPAGTDDPADWPAWASLRPHALAAERAAPGHDGLRDLACSVGWYLLQSGNTRDGYDLARELRGRWSLQLGSDQDSTLKAIALQACALRKMRLYAEARPLDEHVLAQRRQTLGPADPDTLNAANDLAIDLRWLGQPQAARELDEDTLARRKRTLRRDHFQTLISASNLAIDLKLLGELKAAKKLDEDTLARRKHALGRDHPHTLASASNLADSLRLLGKHKAARKLNEDALARRRRVLGDDHPDTLASAGSLAITGDEEDGSSEQAPL